MTVLEMPRRAPVSAPPFDFAGLVRQHQAMVYSIAWHMLRDRAVAEELAQDVFLSLHQHLAEMESSEHVLFWLRRVTSNRALDEARRRQRRPMVSLENAPEPVALSSQDDPLMGSALKKLVAALPEKSRAIVVLRYQEDLDPTGDRQGPGHPGRHSKESIAAGAGALAREVVPPPWGDWCMNLDDELKSALRRSEPSPDFAARVLARVAGAPVCAARQPWIRWAAPIAAALILAAGGIEYRQYQGERAKAQVMLAMRIAGSKLNKAQKKVQMLNHRSDS